MYYSLTKKIGISLLLIIVSSISIISLATYNHHDSSLIYISTETSNTSNWFSIAGAHIAAICLYFFGFMAWLIPVCLLYGVYLVLFNLSWRRELDRCLALAGMGLTGSTIAHYYGIEFYEGIYPGGWFGMHIHYLLQQFFIAQHVQLFLFILTWTLAIIVVRFSFITYLYPLWHLLKRIPVKKWYLSLKDYLKKPVEKEQFNFTEVQDLLERSIEPAKKEVAPKQPKKVEEPVEESTEVGYKIPSLKLFEDGIELKPDPAWKKESELRAQTLTEKLERFGIKGKVTAITQGPVVTLFEYQPSIDTKISTILAREDDLALALQALSLRIMAPIPGRSVIGFEVAHNKRQPVMFADLLRSKEMGQTKASLPMILGKDTLGGDVIIDLASMPHLLVAGSTGSGKSVGLHTMIMSLFCKKSPDEIRCIFIDPKRLEFSAYADCAHLLFPIVTDPRRAVAVLKWAVQQMEDRYSRMAEEQVRNHAEYNAKYKPNQEEYMPFIVIVIDELADLMMTAGKEVEQLIARLAQMARAAGIHMIVATQRPSVDVITGLIKVNFPSRVAYKVTSKVDSRTILDMIGAEKLLGKGDMLFLDTKGTVQRVHGALVTDKEINAVADHIRAERDVVYQELTINRVQETDDEQDDMLEEVIEYIKNKDEVSISLLQRVFRIGYNRSARIIDQLESQGHVLPSDGSKMRKVSKEL